MNRRSSLAFGARSSSISNRSIQLTEKEPLNRLKELCRQGKYNYKINWDRFKNGFMCECIIYYSLHNKTSKMLKKKVLWVETNDLQKAQTKVINSLLEEIGLNTPLIQEVNEVNKEPEEVYSEKVSWAEIVEED